MKSKKRVDPRLAKLRKRIDRADRAWIVAFAARFEAVQVMGELKRSLGLPIVQKTRWTALVRDRVSQAQARGLSPLFLKPVLELVHREAVRLQRPTKPQRSAKRKARG